MLTNVIDVRLLFLVLLCCRREMKRCPPPQSGLEQLRFFMFRVIYSTRHVFVSRIASTHKSNPSQALLHVTSSTNDAPYMTTQYYYCCQMIIFPWCIYNICMSIYIYIYIYIFMYIYIYIYIYVYIYNPEPCTLNLKPSIFNPQP